MRWTSAFLSGLVLRDSVGSMRGVRLKMRATVFHSPHRIAVEEVPCPHAGAGEAVIRITLTTIC
jgi:hypothetical protein